MKLRWQMVTVVLVGTAIGSAQLAPHASHTRAITKPANGAPAANLAKPAVRVNGTVLTEIDVRREMYAIFPYARQHNGFPKGMESEIRNGAIQMIVFEELLYQEAKRRGLAISPERLTKADAEFRRLYPDKTKFDEYLRIECQGSRQVLREKIRRSLLIERMLKTEVEQKSTVTFADARAYYDKNPKLYEHSETVAIQTISIIPAQNASYVTKLEARAKIKDIARLGKAAKTARDFGLIAEQLSEDDWRTRMGDRGTMEVTALPPDVVGVARAMKPGDVSEPIQLGTSWVVIRLNAHTPAGRTSFSQVQSKLQFELQKQKKEQLSATLYERLRRSAKIELM